MNIPSASERKGPFCHIGKVYRTSLFTYHWFDYPPAPKRRRYADNKPKVMDHVYDHKSSLTKLVAKLRGAKGTWLKGLEGLEVDESVTNRWLQETGNLERKAHN
ncbi:MAG: hypothetical protein Q9213_001064 [Squamulea squamosa]